MKSLLLAVSGIAALLAVSPAEALTFDFTINNTTGNVIAFPGGQVTGQIFGLSANGNGQAASEVVVDTVPAGYQTIFPTPTYPLDTLAKNTNSPFDNSFNVTNGVITFFDYDVGTDTAHSPGNEYALQLLTSAGCCGSFSFTVEENSSSQISTNGLGFFVTPTPLPSTWTMLIAGFAGLGFFAYRSSKKRTLLLSQPNQNTLSDFGEAAARRPFCLCSCCSA